MRQAKVLLLGALLMPVLSCAGTDAVPSVATASLRTAAAAIQEASVAKAANGQWTLRVSYFCQPVNAVLSVFLIPAAGAIATSEGRPIPSTSRALDSGRHSLELELERIGDAKPMTTTQIVIEVRAGSEVLAREMMTHRIEWPDAASWVKDKDFATQTSAEILDKAVLLIDIGLRESLGEARELLERLVRREPGFDPAYVELARVAMKTNWGPQGLRQAEMLLTSALEIRPDSNNAQILQGYVYAHQGRFRDAGAMFEKAAQAKDSKNLWLWANWGQMLVKQGNIQGGIAKYREAITRPRTFDTYDRARLDAYQQLIGMLSKSNDLDAVGNLHKQRTDEFGPGTCFAVEYARFLLQQRGNSAQAITHAQRASDEQCKGEEAREVLGLAYYTAWAAEPSAKQGDLLRQARIYVATGPRLFYQLAAGPMTVAAVQRLKAMGEQIDQLDDRRFTALALALEDSDLAAAERLLKLGASSDAPVGPFEMPVALLPVVKEDIDAIRLMQRHGVDYNKLRYRGATALDHARSIGNQKLIDALDRRARSL